MLETMELLVGEPALVPSGVLVTERGQQFVAPHAQLVVVEQLQGQQVTWLDDRGVRQSAQATDVQPA